MEAGGGSPRRLEVALGVSIWKEILEETVQLKLNFNFEVGREDEVMILGGQLL